MPYFVRRLLSFVLAFSLLLLAIGCAAQRSSYAYYTHAFFGVFDTVVQFGAYAQSPEEFEQYADFVEQRFTYYSHLYDRFCEYDGINNIKTINDHAGIAPVEVSSDILDLLEFCQEWYEKTDGQVNIAMGPVISIWHEYMERYSGTEDGVLPGKEALEAAAALTDISQLIIDRQNNTVFLAQGGMLLDLGAVAKGYAAQRIAEELRTEGAASFLINAGGNVVAADPPMEKGRTGWGIALRDPLADPNDSSVPVLNSVNLSNGCVVTSGDYERFYLVDGVRYCHIIDPLTLFPARYYRSVTVVCEDSGIADLASTALFTLPYEQSLALAEKSGWKALWVFADGRITCTDSMLPLLRDRDGITGG